VADNLLEVRNLSVEFNLGRGILKAVSDVSYDVRRGETLAVLGESGSGKSVSSLAIMGLVDTPGRITAGSIKLDGEEIIFARPSRRRQINGQSISMVFQDPLAALNPVFYVGWQVAEAFRIHGRRNIDVFEQTVALLDRVGIPDARRRVNDYPHQFSGGQRQRIVIAIAIALGPKLLVADEPTSALDVTVQAEILKLLKQMQAEYGMGMLVITHDLSVVTEIADRVAVMLDGKIVETGTVADVFAAPQHPYTRRLLDSMPGRGAAASANAASTTELLVEARDLHKSYGVSVASRPAVKAVDGVSLSLRAGESVGIVGESGSGKSTLSRLLLAIEKPDTGTVTMRGRDIFAQSKDEKLAFRRRMQVIFQDPGASFNPYARVWDILTEPWVVHKDVLPKAQWKDEVARLLETVGLSPSHINRYPHQFSGGQRQRLAIARALTLRPEVIVCDEALSALDVSLRAQILALLKSLGHEFGISYIFIAHDLAMVREFCDRVYVMYRGKVVEQGDVETVFEHPQHPYTQRLLEASMPQFQPVPFK
jgi:peptide/nickel transport system ATP-binding protein